MIETKQVAYLETVENAKWMDQNLDSQKKSKFIREAVATKIKLDKSKYNKSK